MKIKTMIVISISCLFILMQSSAKQTKRAIIVGASSGMGREVAKRLAQEGYELGLCGRRVDLLKSLQEELDTHTLVSQIDVTQPSARQQLEDLITQMGDLDLMVISISAYLDNRNGQNLDEWTAKERTLDVDAKGFIAMADVATEYFKQQNHGHLVGISSTSGQRGVAYAPVYSAAKACISTYMEAQRNYMIQNGLNVQITDVVPGWVAVEHSPLGTDHAAYWEITTQQAGQEIVEGIFKQQKTVYVPSKVWFISLLLKRLPDWIYNRFLPWI